MGIVFLLQIYFITSSTGKNWRTINIYNKMVTPNKVCSTQNSSVTIYCGSSSPVSWTYLPVIPSNGAQVPDFRRHTAGMKTNNTEQIILDRFWYVLLQRYTRGAGFYRLLNNSSSLRNNKESSSTELGRSIRRCFSYSYLWQLQPCGMV